MNRCIFMVITLSILCLTPLLAQTPRRTLAVMEFDYGAVQPWWEGTWNIGRGISDLVVDQLVRNGTFTMVERERLIQVQDEAGRTRPIVSRNPQSNSPNPMSDEKVLRADALLFGSIQQFGLENQKKGGKGGWWRKGIFGFDFQKTKGKAKVVLSMRLVESGSSKILHTVTGEGVSERSGLILEGLGIGKHGGGWGGVSMLSSNYRETILGEATYRAVEDLTKNLLASADKIPFTPLETRGMVAHVDGDRVVLNIGTNHGVQVGATLKVYAVKLAIKDPASGETIREETEVLGSVKVEETDQRSSVARIVTGLGKITVGAMVTRQ